MAIRIEDLSDTDFSDVVDSAAGMIATTHPGEIVLHDFLEPLGMSANALAKAIGVPANRVCAILNGSRGISADTALRLARYFGTTPDFWLGLQAGYDLETTRKIAGEAIRRSITPLRDAA